MLLLLVRHAQSEANARLAGATIDCPLTDLGRRQAAAAAQKLVATGIDLVLCSPYARALQTAEMIRAAANVPAEIVPLLHEHHLHGFPAEWPLMSRTALAEQFPHFRVPDDWRDADWHTPPEDGEAALERARRVLADLSARFAATPDVRVALV